METSSTQSLTFYDFLDRMRNPTSLDLVRSIKSFIVSFSFHMANPENDGKRLQDFLLTMEVAIRDHPLWDGATEEEIDCAIEIFPFELIAVINVLRSRGRRTCNNGLEKYVMTKLFSRTFASFPEDAKIDLEISEKIRLLQNFLKPEHLDIPVVLHNEASWLLAEKELQKINAFKNPREKLLCVLNCCRVINNLLLNASMSENRVSGADDFLPILVYVTIKANPPQLHSNLMFIQLYRRQAKLVSEEAYYFTSLVSAKTFILDLDAKSISMNETEFQESMQAAGLVSRGIRIEPPSAWDEIAAMPVLSTRIFNKMTQTESSTALDKIAAFMRQTAPGPSTGIHDNKTEISGELNYPFIEAEAGELTVGDVERLLSLYKDVVKKYTGLCKVIGHFSKSPLTHFEETNVLQAQPEEKMK
ncbi:vacuolar protein sorting-associated protein 9A-like isoform X1 [Cornus florida]|uniref:vacuolar protein sorting-associated protein 9A-like isoform X1 n=1 Tax=Cornus florida TaxID=4283 RepID=UPI002899C112|nr:vacuolar protein sorting-associated protein 9A-like isoform X1 [Cornus florida]XP_059631057.1 vacuolar protein sorting-associated protein 9A-like isoform X1 [Cornus florida]XP_059631058.1 vacuolar protein sorting-associated protein 9A-like isoform X1 [Cornus florida]XP_059631059.1 vacuolar protein sorting-associated protein 9A-like isoform X1 [Cornus florida]XP_059631060.1 vacuolar protein sorting-associated protein 9A-like isoform X1 [Cornus florida]